MVLHVRTMEEIEQEVIPKVTVLENLASEGLFLP
jgi:hypothetical protein